LETNRNYFERKGEENTGYDWREKKKQPHAIMM